jgi:SAM-dependent methyltransferase
MLDIGGATSHITGDLKKFGRVVCIEPDHATAALARARQGITVLDGALPDRIPTVEPADVITLLDVLEHIDNDKAALRSIHGLLTTAGVVVITVPALSWLWSDHDRVLHHKRRYTKQTLTKLLVETGFSVQRISYYTTALLPLVALSRMAANVRHGKRERPLVYDAKLPAKPINRALEAIMTVEQSVLRHANLPIGSALFAVARPQRGYARSAQRKAIG